jgi:hypothetical protein
VIAQQIGRVESFLPLSNETFKELLAMDPVAKNILIAVWVRPVDPVLLPAISLPSGTTHGIWTLTFATSSICRIAARQRS